MTLAGFTVSPRNFTNPITLPDNTYPLRDFDAVAGKAILSAVLRWNVMTDSPTTSGRS